MEDEDEMGSQSEPTEVDPIVSSSVSARTTKCWMKRGRSDESNTNLLSSPPPPSSPAVIYPRASGNVPSSSRQFGSS